MSPVINLAGKTFGRWTVISYAGAKKWLVRCSCTTLKEVHGSTLRDGQSKGCLECSIGRTTHGMHGTRAYQSWAHMITRCHNPASSDYKFYGARGISVCDHWRQNFAAFHLHVGDPPEGYWIDRFPNNNGNYEPGNVRWASPQEQQRNTRRNLLVEYKGERRTLVELAELTGIHYDCLRRRFHSGWSDSEIVLSDKRPRRSAIVGAVR